MVRSSVVCLWLAGCGSSWQVIDQDGDGITVAQGDCWDLVEGPEGSGLSGRDIFPGATETWYDGIDQNCGGDDDFDLDGDGWVPTGYAGQATLGVPGTGSLPEGDCWDDPSTAPTEQTVVAGTLDTDVTGMPYAQPTAADVNPGISPDADTWYDGADVDCAGNDDFDQDGDGYDTMHHVQPDGTAGDDCIDGSWRDWDNLADVPASAVNPSAAEVWYDGTDEDCDELTADCDADGDGYWLDGLDAGVCLDDSQDCNDADPLVFPTDDAEVFYNGKDDNCNLVDEDGDMDGDGYWAEDYESILAAAGITVDDTVTLPDASDPRDCWDDTTLTEGEIIALGMSPVSGFTDLAAGEVYPGALDRPYDAVDQDCAGEDANADGAEDDFDWDGDAYESEFHLNRLGRTGSDCLDCPDGCYDTVDDGELFEAWCDAYCMDDDDNPAHLSSATINPGNVDDEPYDGTDADCDDWSDYDTDRDGQDAEHFGGTDCVDDGMYDDANPGGVDPADIHLGATETWYDGTDQDCDNLSDNDADGDGYDSEGQGGTDCVDGGRYDDSNPAGLTAAAVHPGATESWYDGTDQDCNDASDNDADEDGYDSEHMGGTDCIDGSTQDDANPAGLADSAVHPGATDAWYDGTDADCDDNDGDADGDGYYIDSYAFADHGGGYDSGDCDDTDSDEHPGADESCDGDDDDCDGDVDEDDAVDASDWYADADGDGYGDADVSHHQCYQPTGYVSDDTDCDDGAAGTNPGATEVCDAANTDEDCDGLADDEDSYASGKTTYYPDSDSDTYGDETAAGADYCDPPSGYVTDHTDCDDDAVGTNPGADEYCDGADDDCDGTIDEDSAVDVSTWYADADSDGYGDASSSDLDCYQPSGYVSDATDCDDATATTNPGADEYCDGTDDDCDGTIDEDSAVDVSTWYADADSDGYGDASSSDLDCYQPSGYVSDATDCDDATATTNPGADEYCDGVDDDCDGTIDEDSAVDVSTWYADSDGDGYGDSATTDVDCYQPTGYLSDATDCDDAEDTVYPGAVEVCDGQYNDCDDASYSSTSAPADETDDDGDGYVECTLDSGGWDGSGSILGDDCDDTDSAANPGEDEVCNDGVDNDCDGTTGTTASGATCAVGDQSLADANLKLTGEVAGDDAGMALALGGDVDGDGVDDMLVAAPYGDTAATNAGQVYLLYGATTLATVGAASSESLSTADVILEGEATADILGRGLAIGDLDADGYADLALGAPLADPNGGGSGSVYIFFGPLTAGGSAADADVIYDGDAAGSYAGLSLAMGQDVDRDGLGDLLIGVSESSLVVNGTDTGPGYAVLMSGATAVAGTWSDYTVDGRLYGDTTGDAAGYQVAMADLDGDGYAELLASAPGATGADTDAGVVYVLDDNPGGDVALSSGFAWLGESKDDRAGYAAAPAGDLNNDGYQDLVVGSDLDDDAGGNAGAAYVLLGSSSVTFTGSASLSTADGKVLGTKDDRLGISVSAAGDLDADGYGDLLAGAWKEDSGAHDAGAAILVYGPVSGTVSSGDAVLAGEVGGDRGGWAVAGGGDVNDDGFDDVLVGAIYDDDGGANAGAAYLVLGLGY